LTATVRERVSISIGREPSTRLTTKLASRVEFLSGMLLPDVNVLVYAHRKDSIPSHAEYAERPA
jgi:hypothetical protein